MALTMRVFNMRMFLLFLAYKKENFLKASLNGEGMFNLLHISKCSQDVP
jgi:hypothetical protein